MQPFFDVERAQERDSSPVIFGTYVEARELAARDVAPAAESGAAALPASRRATATPLPLFAASVTADSAQREAAQREAAQQQGAVRETRAQRETLSSSVQLKLEAVVPAAVTAEEPAPRPLATAVDSAPEDIEAQQRAAHDSRMAGAWREWLGALARDPEAALAAAQAYQQLDSAGRDEWLNAVESDLAGLGVPAVAVYSPLLAVESDPQRTQTMRQRIARGHVVEPPSSVPRRALLGRLANGVRLGVLVEPLYLQFVQVLACAYVPAQRFSWVRHDPIALDAQALNAGHVLEGAVLEVVPVRLLVDELARTVVSHRRLGGTLPDALCLFANLFGLEHMVGGCDELTLR